MVDIEDGIGESPAITSMSKLVAVTNENQALRSTLLDSQNQYDSLEQAFWRQIAKTNELQELLALTTRGDNDGLAEKILHKSLLVAEQSLEIDQLRLKLQEAEKGMRLMDQERDANAEMMGELNKVIRQQHIELQNGRRGVVESSSAGMRSEYKKKHDNIINGGHSEGEKQRDNSSLPKEPLSSEPQELQSQLDIALKKTASQKHEIVFLKKRSQERDARHSASLKQLKNQIQSLEEDGRRKSDVQRLLEQEVERLKNKDKQEVSTLGVDDSWNPDKKLVFSKSRTHHHSIFFHPGFLKADSDGDDSSLTEDTIYTSTDSDPSGPTLGTDTANDVVLEFITERISV